MSAGAGMLKTSGKRYLGSTGKRRLRDATAACVCGCNTDGNCTCKFSACPTTDFSLQCPLCCDGKSGVFNRTPNAFNIVISGVQVCPDKTYCISCGLTNFCVRLNQSTFAASFNVTPVSACLYRFTGDAIDYMTLDQSDGAGGHVPFTDRSLKVLVQFGLPTTPGVGGSGQLTVSLAIRPCGTGGSGATVCSFRMTNPSCCSTPNPSAMSEYSTCAAATAAVAWGYLGSATASECAS